MKKVEQVDNKGNIVLDYDEKMSFLKIFSLLKEILLGFSVKKEDKQFLINGRLSFLACNVTYLGNPHAIYKKRIQLKSYFPKYYELNNEKNIKTIFLGIYTYQQVNLFVIFNTSSYINNEFHNSSAHVYSTDLQEGYKKGFFRRIDRNKNEIIVLSRSRFIEYVSRLLNGSESISEIEYQNKLLLYFDSFFKSIPLKIDGLKAYQSMILADYSDKIQIEWCGFYFEFLFDNYYILNNTNLILRKVKMDYTDKNGKKIIYDKKKVFPDLDLKFPLIDYFYGDLKSDNALSGIQGNDYESVHNIISNGGTIWYILMDFTPHYDVLYNYEVLNYLIKFQKPGKDGIENKFEREKKKIKHDIEVNGFSILNINESTWKYIRIYNQGVNSDGKPRAPKISIPRKFVDILKIYSFSIK